MAELVDRMKYEEAAVRKFGYLSAQHRRELRQLLGSPPDAANVPEEFWAKVQKEHEAEALALLALLLAASATQHGLNGEDATRQARDWAEREAAQRAADWVQNSRETLQQKSSEWRSRQQQPPGTDGATTDGSPLITDDEIDETTDAVFGKRRVERMVATETTRAQHAGSEIAIATTVGLSPDDIWHTENDQKVCPVCSPLNLTPRSFWSRFFPEGPPGPHPNCRCWIEYVNAKNQSKVTP